MSLPSPITELVVDLNIKEKYMVVLVHDSKSMAASESSNVLRHEWAVGSDHPSVFLSCIVVGGQSDKTPGCCLGHQGSSKWYGAGDFSLSRVSQENAPVSS